MKTEENLTQIQEIEIELPLLLDELSFSYSMVYSAQQSLDDLDKSISELGVLMAHLEE